MVGAKIMQQEMILRAMFTRPDKKFWSAKDGRYRILSINWEAKEEIDLIIERLGNNEYRM